MFGEGEIDFVPVLRTLHEIGYTGGVHVELSRHSHDAVQTAELGLQFRFGTFSKERIGNTDSHGFSQLVGGGSYCTAPRARCRPVRL